MKKFKSLAIAVSSLCVLPTVVHAKVASSDNAGMAMMRLNAATVSDGVQQYNTTHDVARADKTYGGSVWQSLRNDFRMAEVNSSLVRSHEYKFATNSAYFNRTINRSKPYMYHIVNEVKKRGMPAEIALLPFIESAYVTKAKSHVGASGLWQFMPATGRHYGLEQTPLYDGRHDVYAATDAALNYLQYLHRLFGDWSLALAAYNWGEGNVTRAVRRAQASGLAPTYENLKMPAETRNYVPKLLAVRNLVRNPQSFGLNLPDINNAPHFKAVTVNTPVDIMAAAHLANISESEFLALNPAFKTPVFIPKKGRKMLLPVHAAKTFETNYKNADVKSLLSWDVYTPNRTMSLAEIAAQTGTDLGELRRLNGLNGGTISAGRSVLVAKNGKAPVSTIAVNFVAADTDNTPDTFVETKQPILTNFVAKESKASTSNNAPVVVKQDFVVASRSKQSVPADAVPFVPSTTNTETISVDNSVLNTSAQTFTFNTDNATVVSNEGQAALVHDPLMEVANERVQALKRAREMAQAKRAEEQRAKAAKQAAKIAEAKEAKRKQQERLRAERLQQAQQLAAIRKARESGESIAVAIRNQQKDASASTHRVQQGDTLFNIAQRYNMNVADLVNTNNLRGTHIRIGQVLKISGSNKKATTTQNNEPSAKKVSLSGSSVGVSNRPVSIRDMSSSDNMRKTIKLQQPAKTNKVNTKTKPKVKLISS